MPLGHDRAEAARLPRARSRSASRTRAHSVTTWRARRRSTGSASALRSPSAQSRAGAEDLGRPLALGPARGVGGRAASRRGASLCTITNAASVGDGHLAGLECGEVDAAARARRRRRRWPADRAGPRARRRCARASWQVRASASGSASWPSGEAGARREGGARGQARPDRDGAGHPGVPPLGGGCRRRSPAARSGHAGGTGAVLPNGDLEGLVGELVRVDADEEAAGPRREGDLGGQVDGHGQRQAAVVVGVVADDGHSSGGAGGGHDPSLTQSGPA